MNKVTSVYDYFLNNNRYGFAHFYLAFFGAIVWAFTGLFWVGFVLTFAVGSIYERKQFNERRSIIGDMNNPAIASEIYKDVKFDIKTDLLMNQFGYTVGYFLIN